MRSRVLWALCLVSLLCAWPAMAQEQSGSIVGVVKDSSGGVLPGVTVEARSPQVVGASTAVTDERGVYRFPALPPGTYVLTANLQGFNQAKANATLVLGQMLTIELTMSVGNLEESVQVTAESPLIDTKQNASFSTVSKEVIERIPKGRDFTDVIQTAPGAQAESKSGGTQIDGASGSENRFIIDGMDTTNLQNGTSGKTMLVDFIQEVQVKSSGYNAEFGGATGGVVSAITKSGSNQLRGSLGTYYNSHKLYGEQRNYHSYSPWNSNLPEKDLVDTRTPYLYLSPVADIGGPILRDKMWFYGGMAYTLNSYERDAIFDRDPTATVRHFDWDTKAYYPNYNLTTQLTNNIRLRVSGSNQRNFDRGTAPTLQPENRTYLGTATPQTLALLYNNPTKGLTTATFDKNADGSINQAAYDRRWSLYENDSTNDVVSGNLDWLISPKFFINTTAGFYRTNNWTGEKQRGNDIRRTFSGSPSDAFMDSQGFPRIPKELQQASGYSDNLSSSGTVRNIYDRIYLNANGTYYASVAGQHIFKAGTRYERFGNDIYNGNAFPVITLYYGQRYSTTAGQTVAGKYGYYIVNKTGTIGKVHSNNYSFWLQDTWSVSNRLTINAGVRVENELVPSYKEAEDAVDLKFGFGDKIAPRLGFAYDVKGDGKWKAYGSYGWFYDITKLSLPRGAFGGDHWINYYWTLDTPDWPSLKCDEGTSGCSGTFIEQWDARHSSNQPDPDLSAYFNRPGMTGIDPDIKPVKTGEFTVGLDRELNSTMSLGVRYVHKWLSRTIEDVGIIIPDVGEIYVIGNPGFGVTETMEPDYPEYKTPKARRDYDSVELRLRRRFANRWSAEVSYAWSRLFGNYGGLASSDEPNASGVGRTDPNINRYFDSLLMSYDKNNQEVEGLLATDRPHVVKVQGTYDLPWGTSIGAYGIIQSGLPMTSQINWNGYPVYYNGRGDMGRLPVYKNVDLQVAHDFRLGQSQRITVLANVSNLFDTQSVAGYYTTQKWRDRVSPAGGLEAFYGGPWDPNQVVAEARAAGATVRDADWYGAPDLFQGYRQIRFQVKYSF